MIRLSLLILIWASHLSLAVVNFYLDEEVQLGTLVGNFASQQGLFDGENTFTLVPISETYNGANFFRLNVKTGEIYTTARIDRDNLCVHYKSCCNQGAFVTVDCVIPLRITQRSLKTSKLQFEMIHVHVRDLNDNVARWSKKHVQLSVPENLQLGQTISVEAAIDPDVGLNGTQRYELIDPSGTFQISREFNSISESMEITLSTLKMLDREQQEMYNMTLLAFDGAKPSRSGSVYLQISLQDINDNSPRFDKTIYRAKIREDIARHSQVLQLHANDPDQGVNGQVVYQFEKRTSTAIKEMFQIGRESGKIILVGQLDYERMGSDKWFNFLVEAQDQNSEPLKTTCTVSIQVEDVNDCKPNFSLMRIDANGQLTHFNSRVEIPENEEPGYTVGLASVEDCDSGPAGHAECHMADESLLRLQTPRGADGSRLLEILTLQKFDRELQEFYTINIICRDHGDPPFEKAYSIQAQVLDKNDNAPVFQQSSPYSFKMSEGESVSPVVGKVMATDADVGKNGDVTYSIVNNSPSDDDAKLFQINPRTGVLQTVQSLDREVKDQLQFYVNATDNGTPRQSSIISVIVNVLDVNDQTPEFKEKHYTFTILENQAAKTLVGMLDANDSDIGDNAILDFRFNVQNQRSYLSNQDDFPFLVSVAPDNPNRALIYTKRSIDREEIRRSSSTDHTTEESEQSTYHFQLLAIDRGYPRAHTATTLVTVIVDDVNDESPRWIFPSPHNQMNGNVVNVSIDAQIGSPVSILRAKDKDIGEHAKIEYRILSGDPEGLFVLDPNSGTLQVCRKLTQVRSYRLILVAQDYPNARHNESRLENKAVLRINVVPSVHDAGQNQEKQRPSSAADEDPNVIVIIVLISATAAIALMLLFIILVARFLVGRRTQHSKMHSRRGIPEVCSSAAMEPLNLQQTSRNGTCKSIASLGYFSADLRNDLMTDTIQTGMNTTNDLMQHTARTESGFKQIGLNSRKYSGPNDVEAAHTIDRLKCNNYQVSTMLRGGTMKLQPSENTMSDVTEQFDAPDGSSSCFSSQSQSAQQNTAYQALQTSTQVRIDSEGHYYDIVKAQNREDYEQRLTGGALDLKNLLVQKDLNVGKENSDEMFTNFSRQPRLPIYQSSFV